MNRTCSSSEENRKEERNDEGKIGVISRRILNLDLEKTVVLVDFKAITRRHDIT